MPQAIPTQTALTLPFLPINQPEQSTTTTTKTLQDMNATDSKDAKRALENSFMISVAIGRIVRDNKVPAVRGRALSPGIHAHTERQKKSCALISMELTGLDSSQHTMNPTNMPATPSALATRADVF